ncbi:MAG: hypothetical protein ACKOFH_05855 [Chthoniobacterales bacterium]
MKTKLGRIVAVSALVFVAATGCASAELIFKESFAGPTVPSGWIMNGRENSPNSGPDTGTAKTDSDWFLSDATGSFLRLTESSPQQRTTAIFTENLFRTDKDFVFRMDLRIPAKKSNADGIGFFWLDADSVGDIGRTIGGSGEWLGTPRGDVTGTPGSANETVSYGWYAGLRGYALEFDHYSNDPSEPPEYTALLNLSDWSHLRDTITDFSSDPNFYLNNGWQTVQFGYRSDADEYTLSWGYDGSAFANSKTYANTGVQRFASAYFGFGAGTHGLNADQDVRNVILEGSFADPPGPAAVPEPGTWAAGALLTIGAVIAFWRRRKSL